MNREKLVIGILAHVDAGKTTLAENLLYLTGNIRKLGRVDHKDAFLDTFELERQRGITIFSKQARLELNNKIITLLDTPGHVDFSSEMERTLQVLDYAILVISAADGVYGHTQTLWKLLKTYNIPTFIFVNKMDQPGMDKINLLKEIQSELSKNCIDFNNDDVDNFYEHLAMCDEQLLQKYLEDGKISFGDICELVKSRNVFPCYFGSALKTQGISEFIDGISYYTKCNSDCKEFGARVYKIGRDETGNRLTYLKVTGGSLKVKMLLSGSVDNDNWNEKIDQIRVYSGKQYSLVDEADLGTVCAVTGLTKTFAGQGLGFEREIISPCIESILNYQIILPDNCNVHEMLKNLRMLEEEEPQLSIVWNEKLKEIHVNLMGDIQIEILKSLIYERFGVEVEFDSGNVVYKESIAKPVIGIGHFEPLKHYAEVHLLLEPAKRGSGLHFKSKCSEDILDKNWQRLTLTHLSQKHHVGVLTGFDITDITITLIAGRAHVKHTEGGDFRQATYRAVRQGLMKADNILLEPFYDFRLCIPSEVVGRALSDIQRMSGSFETPVNEGEMTVIIGKAPVVTMRGYHREVISYSKGRGTLSCVLCGYLPCHNSQEIIQSINYNAQADVDNPANSVFCANGAGYIVPWEKVDEYKHVENKYTLQNQNENKVEKKVKHQNISNEDELKQIFERTYGSIKQKRNTWTKSSNRIIDSSYKIKTPKSYESREEFLLVDGYNIIFAWEELNELSKLNLDAARTKLMDILCNYQGFKQINVILVFDAYKVKGNVGEVIKYHNIDVVFTKEAETADQYIEKVTHEIGKKYNVTVATSDALEQRIIWGNGARRLSAKGLFDEIEYINKLIKDEYLQDK